MNPSFVMVLDCHGFAQFLIYPVTLCDIITQDVKLCLFYPSVYLSSCCALIFWCTAVLPVHHYCIEYRLTLDVIMQKWKPDFFHIHVYRNNLRFFFFLYKAEKSHFMNTGHFFTYQIIYLLFSHLRSISIYFVCQTCHHHYNHTNWISLWVDLHLVIS